MPATRIGGDVAYFDVAAYASEDNRQPMHQVAQFRYSSPGLACESDLSVQNKDVNGRTSFSLDALGEGGCLR